MTTGTLPFDAWLAAANNSHRRLAGVVAPLSAEQVAGPSYASEWSIAQVLSHLGSGAEIFTLFLRTGIRGEPAPGADEFAPVFEHWNAKVPKDQVADALVADAAFLEQLDALDEQERRSWRLSMFGADQELSDLLRLRLGEHALHTWDVVVTRDMGATVAHDAVELLIDTLDQLVPRVGKPTERPLRVQITPHDPTRRFLLNANGEGANLQMLEHPARPKVEKTLQLPAEAFIRLVYGRLDPQHTPMLQSNDVDIDVLRQIFPGF